MRFNTIAPILTTDDMERSVRFYVDVLGFACGLRTPAFANLSRDSIRIMLGAPNAHDRWEGPRFTGQLYIGQDVDELWAKLKNRVEIVYPLTNFDYGMREFGIRDDSGYPLAFGAHIAKLDANG